MSADEQQAGQFAGVADESQSEQERAGCQTCKADDGRYQSALEALLFVSDEPQSASVFANVLGLSASDVTHLLESLATRLREEERGVQLREVAGGWRLYTHPAHHELIERYVLSWDTHKLSQAALEALAVIAYHQPASRNVVNAVRGVNSAAVISSLVEKGLVREVGRDRMAGNAILYGTTRTFLEKFGLKSLSDLPPLEDFAPDEDSRQLIRERLSAAGAAPTPEISSTADGQATISFDQAEQPAETVTGSDEDECEGHRLEVSPDAGDAADHGA